MKKTSIIWLTICMLFAASAQAAGFQITANENGKGTVVRGDFKAAAVEYVDPAAEFVQKVLPLLKQGLRIEAEAPRPYRPDDGRIHLTPEAGRVMTIPVIASIDPAILAEVRTRTASLASSAAALEMRKSSPVIHVVFGTCSDDECRNRTDEETFLIPDPQEGSLCRATFAPRLRMTLRDASGKRLSSPAPAAVVREREAVSADFLSVFPLRAEKEDAGVLRIYPRRTSVLPVAVEEKVLNRLEEIEFSVDSELPFLPDRSPWCTLGR